MTLDTLYNQDMLIGIRSIPTESIDCIVSDVPYRIALTNDSLIHGIFDPLGKNNNRKKSTGGGNNQQVTKNMEIDTLYNQDCLQGMADIPAESIDAVVTDCPYTLVGGGCSEGNYKTANGHSQPSGTLNRQREYVRNADGVMVLKGTKHINLGGSVLNDQAEAVRQGKMFQFNDIKFSEWLPDVYRVLKKGTHCYIMINSRNLNDLWNEAIKVGFVFQNLLVWNKSNSGGTPNKYYMQKCEFILMLSKRPARNINDMGTPNLLSVPNIIGKGETQHPTAKPVELMEVMIRNSTNEGDIVLDPFAGGGSTLLAAKKLNRRYIGYEIDEKYYNLATKRLENIHRFVQTTLFD